MEKETVIQKIRKLLKLQYGAEKIGNSGEAYQAAKMVRKLLLEYNLSMSDIHAADQQEQSRIVESDPLSYADQYGVSWKQNLLMIICRYNLCSVIVCPRTKQMNIVGLDANVIIVKEFYEYLLQVFRRLSMERLNEAQNEYLGTGRFMTEPKKKDFLRSYLEGVSRGLQENYESQQPTSQETGLMVCHKELIKGYLASKSIGKARRYSTTKVRPDGFNAGFDDGRNVNLSKQLNTSGRAAGQLK